MDKIINYYLNCDINIKFNWANYIVTEDEEQSWTQEMKQLFQNITLDDILTALKWCHYKGDIHEQVKSAIYNILIINDLPSDCDFELEFLEKECAKV